MPKSDAVRLQHALDAAHQAIRFTDGMTVEALRRDERTTMAALYAITIVGEALSQVSPEFRSRRPDVPWRDAIGMRNRLVHGYDEVDYQRVLDTATGDLPRLCRLSEKALGEMS